MEGGGRGDGTDRINSVAASKKNRRRGERLAKQQEKKGKISQGGRDFRKLKQGSGE